MKQNQHKVGSFDHNYDIKKVLRASRILNFAFRYFRLKVKSYEMGHLTAQAPSSIQGYTSLLSLC